MISLFQVGNSPQNDCIAFIGYTYILRGFGHTVAEIYTASREWDTSHYPDAFFDSCRK
jgi:hypothetical protein